MTCLLTFITKHKGQYTIILFSSAYLRGSSKKFSPRLTHVKLGTSSCWVGTRTGADITSTLVVAYYGSMDIDASIRVLWEYSIRMGLRKILVNMRIVSYFALGQGLIENSCEFNIATSELELIYLYFPPSFHQTLSTGLLDVEVTSVSWLGQLTVEV